METKTKFNKVMDVISKCITVLLFVFTACIMIFTIFSVTTIDKNDRNILGYKFYIVQTDSMSASDKNAHLDVHFDAGDIILVKGVDKSTELKAGDIISFISFNKESYGETVTHMIREVKTNSAGKVIGLQVISQSETFMDRYLDGDGCYTGVELPRGSDISAGAKRYAGIVSVLFS